MNDKPLCLIELCQTKAYARGICAVHYKMIRMAVKSGARTWQEFIDMEMVLPLRSGRVNYGVKRDQFEMMLKAREAKAAAVHEKK